MKVIKVFWLMIGCLFMACKGRDHKVGNLPAINILLVDSASIFNVNAVVPGKPVVLFFFSPDCSHCQKLTDTILGSMDEFKNVQFCFITIDPMERMKVYNQHYKIYKYSNIHLGRDYSWAFPRYYKPSGPPFLVIYDKDHKERFVYAGEVDQKKLVTDILML